MSALGSDIYKLTMRTYIQANTSWDTIYLDIFHDIIELKSLFSSYTLHHIAMFNSHKFQLLRTLDSKLHTKGDASE